MEFQLKCSPGQIKLKTTLCFFCEGLQANVCHYSRICEFPAAVNAKRSK